MSRIDWRKVHPYDQGQRRRKGEPRYFARYRVIDPRPVLRVGYPFDVKGRALELLTEWGVCPPADSCPESVWGRWTGPYHPRWDIGATGYYETPAGEVDARCAWELAHALVANEARVCGFGGDRRTVHLGEPIPNIAGQVYTAWGVRVVQEGYREHVGYEEGTTFIFERRVKLVQLYLGAPRVIYPLGDNRNFEFPETHLEPVLHYSEEPNG